MVRKAFEAEDLEVYDAANGAEGVQKAQEVKPGLIILDLSMPVRNGLEAARELKVLLPQVPLLMFTNNAAGIVEKEASLPRESTSWPGRVGLDDRFAD